MTFAEFIGIATTSALAGGVGSAIVIYLSKKLLDHRLSQDLHGYMTRYSRLDKQKTDAILQIHGLICSIERQLVWASGAVGTALISKEPERRTLNALNKGWEEISELITVLNYHALLIDESMYKLVVEWSKIMMRSIGEIGGPIEKARQQLDSEATSLEQREDFILKVRDSILERDLPILGEKKRELEVKFRDVLGNKI